MNRRRNILILAVVGMGMVILVSVLGAIWRDYANVFALVLYAGLIAVTVIYAYFVMETAEATREQANASVKMAEEMREQRYDSVRPVIDIERVVADPLELAKEAFAAKDGELPDKLTCILRNIGVGPATDVFSFVLPGTQPDSEYWRSFGALAKGALVKDGEIYKWPLSLKQRDNRKFLVAYYRDVHGRYLESSREVSVDKERGAWNIGPLETRKIGKEEFPK